MANQEIHNDIKFFTQIPAWVDELEDISDFQARLLGYIYTFENVTGTAFPSNSHIAKRFHKKQGSVQNALSDLYAKGYLRSEKVYKDDTKIIEKRYLYVVEPYTRNNERGIHKKITPYTQNNVEATHLKVEDNILINKSSNKSVNKGNMSGSKEQDNIPYKEIVDYLNEKTGKNFKVGTDATRRVIKARFAEKNTLEDFKKVIDVKSAEWRNDVKMQRYLQPSTLFGTKFEGYLNQSVGIKNNSQDIRNMSSEDISKLSEREIAEKWMGKDWVR